MKVLHLSLLASLLFSGTALAENSDLNKKINDCNQFIKDGMPEKALDFAAQLLKQNKGNREVVLCKGRAQTALNQFGGAVDTLKQAEQLSTSPTEHMMAWAMVGNAYLGNQQYSEAIVSYQQSLELAKTQKLKNFERIAQGLIAQTLSAQKQYDEAISHYQAGLKLAGNDGERADTFEKIAAIYEQQGKQDMAIEYQVKAVVTHTHYGDLDNQANAGIELGRMYIAAGIFDQAENSINKVLKLAVDNGGAYWEAKSNWYLAKLKLASHQQSQAKSLLEKALKLAEEVGDAGLANEIVSTMSQLPN